MYQIILKIFISKLKNNVMYIYQFDFNIHQVYNNYIHTSYPKLKYTKHDHYEIVVNVIMSGLHNPKIYMR